MMADVPQALTREQVAERYQVCERTIRKLEFQHSIPVLRLGRSVRYDARALAALEEAVRASVVPQALPARRRGLTPRAAQNQLTGSQQAQILIDEILHRPIQKRR